MSFDESFLSELLDALQKSGLQVIIIGNTAAILQGIPVMTRDVDLFVQNHEQLDKKLKRFADFFEVSLTKPYPSNFEYDSRSWAFYPHRFHVGALKW